MNRFREQATPLPDRNALRLIVDDDRKIRCPQCAGLLYFNGVYTETFRATVYCSAGGTVKTVEDRSEHLRLSCRLRCSDCRHVHYLCLTDATGHASLEQYHPATEGVE